MHFLHCCFLLLMCAYDCGVYVFLDSFTSMAFTYSSKNKDFIIIIIIIITIIIIYMYVYI